MERQAPGHLAQSENTRWAFHEFEPGRSSFVIATADFFLVVFCVPDMFCFSVFGCQYQCRRLPVKSQMLHFAIQV